MRLQSSILPQNPADVNCLYHVLDFELVKELSVQHLLAYGGILYLQTSSELPLY